MPWSFWHAFSKSLVAVAISSPVTWHNVSWAIDWAMRCKRSLFHLGCDDSVNWAAVAPVGDGQWAALLQVVGLPRWLRKGGETSHSAKERQRVHPTLSEHPVLRLPRKSHRRPRDARAYIRPLAEHQVLRLPHKSHPQRRPRNARAYIRPLQSTQCCACNAKATRRAAETSVHPTSAEHQVPQK